VSAGKSLPIKEAPL